MSEHRETPHPDALSPEMLEVGREYEFHLCTGVPQRFMGLVVITSDCLPYSYMVTFLGVEGEELILETRDGEVFMLGKYLLGMEPNEAGLYACHRYLSLM